MRAEISKQSTDHYASVGLFGQGIDRAVRAALRLKSRIQRPVRQETGQTMARLAVERGEVATDKNLPVTQREHGVHLRRRRSRAGGKLMINRTGVGRRRVDGE